MRIENIVEIIFLDQFCENKLLFPLFGAKLWVPVANACLPWGQVPKICECIMKFAIKIEM